MEWVNNLTDKVSDYVGLVWATATRIHTQHLNTPPAVHRGYISLLIKELKREKHQPSLLPSPYNTPTINYEIFCPCNFVT